MSSTQSRLDSVALVSSPIVEVLGLLVLSTIVCYQYVRGGLLELVLLQSIRVSLVTAGCLSIYLGGMIVLAYRCRKQTESLLRPLLTLVFLPTGPAIVFSYFINPGLRGPLLVSLLAASGWILWTDRTDRTVIDLSVLVSGAGLALLVGGFYGIDMGFGQSPPGTVSINIGYIYQSAVFGVQTPTLLFTGDSFAHGVFLTPVVIGAIGYIIGSARILRVT